MAGGRCPGVFDGGRCLGVVARGIDVRGVLDWGVDVRGGGIVRGRCPGVASWGGGGRVIILGGSCPRGWMS